ncbi:MAG: NADP-dependent oxidoreductase, partial [Burkholderiales bacterium PBB4]
MEFIVTNAVLTDLVNHQIRLAARPVGLPKASDWNPTTEAVAAPTAGGVTLKTLSLSLDPAMRGWMNEGKSYIPPVGIGEVMRAGGVGVVVASENAHFAVGDYVSAMFGVQEYTTLAQADIKRNGLVKIDLRAGTLHQWLNVLGMPGMT